MIVVSSVLAMAPTPPGTQPNPTGQMLQMLSMVVFFVVVMYFIMIRPQQKKAREHDQLLKSLKPKDKIVTSGGVVGIVVSVGERSVTIRSADTKLEVLKSAVRKAAGLPRPERQFVLPPEAAAALRPVEQRLTDAGFNPSAAGMEALRLLAVRDVGLHLADVPGLQPAVDAARTSFM